MTKKIILVLICLMVIITSFLLRPEPKPPLSILTPTSIPTPIPKSPSPQKYSIDQPLEGDTQDLGNIHKPSLEELALEELHGIPRYNTWYNFVGKGDDGKFYVFHGTFKHVSWQHGKAWLTFGIFEEGLEPAGFLTGFSHRWKKEVSGEKIEYSVSDPGKSVKYTIEENRYLIEANYYNLYINIIFHKESFFWYNKGSLATVYPDCQIAGIEETSRAEGYIVINGRRINVVGLGHSEHFFNKGDITSKITEYGNEWWMPFRFDEVQGIFVVFGDYKDAGFIMDGEYIIPLRFDLFTDMEKKIVRIVAETTKGRLNITHQIFGDIKSEHFATSVGQLNGKDLINGFGWVEHIH